jgi:hypothetical protein
VTSPAISAELRALWVRRIRGIEVDEALVDALDLLASLNPTTVMGCSTIQWLVSAALGLGAGHQQRFRPDSEEWHAIDRLRRRAFVQTSLRLSALRDAGRLEEVTLPGGRGFRLPADRG